MAIIQSHPLFFNFDFAFNNKLSVSAANPITSLGLSLLIHKFFKISGFSTNSNAGGLPVAVFFIFVFALSLGRQSPTAAAHIAISNGPASLTASFISIAVSTLITLPKPDNSKFTGPNINVTSASSSIKHLAISVPCLPELLFPRNLMSSRYSNVGPAVTKIFFDFNTYITSKLGI